MKLILENLIHFRATSIVVNSISFSAVTAKVSQQGKCNKDGKGGRFVSRPCVIPTWLPCKDLSFADSFVINKGNGSVTRGLVHLTEQWNFGEPIQLNNGNVAYKMSVTSKSSVILFIDVKSRRSYLTDKELSNVNCTGFVKLIAQNMTNNSG